MRQAAPPLASSVRIERLDHAQFVPTKSQSGSLPTGLPIKVTCQAYADRWWVTISQYDKIGCLCHDTSPWTGAARDDHEGAADWPRERPVSLVPLMGVAPPQLQDVYTLYATRVSQKISADVLATTMDPMMAAPPKPVIVGLALERWTALDSDDILDMERQRLDVVETLLPQCRVW